MTAQEAYTELISIRKNREDGYLTHLSYSGKADEQEEYTIKAYSVAIEALEKQIPKKPKRVDKNSVFDGNWKMICPRCGATLMKRITTEYESRPVHYNMTKHCNCGQALDWSDTE